MFLSRISFAKRRRNFPQKLQDHAYGMKYNTCQGPIFCSLLIPFNITYNGSLNVNENFCILPFMDAQV